MALPQQKCCDCRLALVLRIIPTPITDDLSNLKVPSSQIRSVWEWIGLEKDINCYWFFIFYFWSWIFDKSSSSELLHAKMNPTSCLFGSQFACAQTAIFFRWTVLQKCRRDINSSNQHPAIHTKIKQNFSRFFHQIKERQSKNTKIFLCKPWSEQAGG